MNRTFVLPAFLAALGAGAGCERRAEAPAVASSTQQSVASEPTPEFKIVATTRQLMQSIIIPASNAVFQAAGEPPQDDAGWLALENQALALAESGNLLQIGTRAMDREHWSRHALALIDNASLAIAASRAKDADKLSVASDAIYAVCEGCHQEYLPKPQ